jgi:phage-related minor tail protein
LVTLSLRQELSALAAKHDLATLITREEIAKLATKEEIAKLATKEEIAKLATREELATLATKEELAEVKAEIISIKSIVIRIENDHGQKLGVLLNGYKQNAARLDRVEAKLAEHDKILMERL